MKKGKVTLLTVHITNNFNYIFELRVTNPKPYTMVKAPTRRYRRVGESTRIRIIALREKGTSLRQIAHQIKVNVNTVNDVLRKWKSHHTIKDLPKTS